MHANWLALTTATALAVSVLVILLTGCEPVIQARYLKQELTRPERPVLPRIKADEIECLSQPTYQKLYDRQRLITDYAITLETIIDATKHAPNDKNIAEDTFKP